MTMLLDSGGYLNMCRDKKCYRRDVVHTSVDKAEQHKKSLQRDSKSRRISSYVNA